MPRYFKEDKRVLAAARKFATANVVRGPGGNIYVMESENDELKAYRRDSSFLKRVRAYIARLLQGQVKEPHEQQLESSSDRSKK